MFKIIFLLLILMLIGFVLDGLWLGLIAKSFYQNSLVGIMNEDPLGSSARIASAVMVYVCIVGGLLYFIIFPQAAASYSKIIFQAAIYGFVLYGVYEFTNFTMVNHWPFKVVIVDLLWGIFLCSSIAASAHYLNRNFFKV